MLEQLIRVPVEVDYGSEYRYRDPIVDERVLAIGISQSGETADTLAAMEAVRDRGGRLATICNVVGSQATRISEGVLYTHAGPEIGVASTKAFTTQLEAIYLLALYLRQVRGSAARIRAPGGASPRPAGGRRGARARKAHQAYRPQVPPRQRLPLPRSRYQLPGGARRRSQAKGKSPTSTPRAIPLGR